MNVDLPFSVEHPLDQTDDVQVSVCTEPDHETKAKAKANANPNDAMADAATENDLKKRRTADINEAIEAWADNIKSSRQNLLTVQLSQNGEPSVSPTFLEKALGTTQNTLTSRAYIFESIVERMIEEQIVVPGQNSISNEWRRKLLCWYESIPEEEKKDIPIVKNSISVTRCLSKVEGMGNLKWARRELPLANQTFNEIEEDLKARGVIASDYKPTKDRKLEQAQKRSESPKVDTWEQVISSLRAIPLSKIEQLVNNDPDRPFKKLLHMFAAASMKAASVSGQKNYGEAFRFVSEHLKEVGFKGQEDPREYITPNYLPRFRSYLAEQLTIGSISSYTADGLLSMTRQMLKRALKIQGIGFTSFVDIQGFDKVRETDEYRPYLAADREKIKSACELEIQETNALAQDYVYSHGGCDPMDAQGYVRNGFASLENARWIFENKLNCQRISRAFHDPNNRYEKGFCQIVDYVEQGIVEIYKSWGVIYEVTSRLLAPYIIRLAQVTGLNADSLVTLDLDDFVECHELSRRPCLRYWKERSGGQKFYHLDLMHADISWLSFSQSFQVKKVFDDVIHLTRHIRARAEGPAKNRLFIYESRKKNEFRTVKTFEGWTLINMVMQQFSKDHLLQTDAGDPLPISASRLRPSLVAELIDNGVSVREIQVILGHKRISTTLKYLDKLEFSKTARHVVEEALKKIHKELVLDAASGEARSTHNTAGAPSALPDGLDPSAIIIRTGLVECRNVYDPPEEIRSLSGYKEGNPCSLLNKCLSCRNCIITVSNLPDLFAMRRDYQTMMDTSPISQTPYGHVIRENLETLDSILTPSINGFEAEQLDEAERLSENIITSSLIEGMTL
ncbi:site-specific integrase [Pseudomonas lundensis]|uniref:site-specific integrase n=1 Tax=Pseudomonas lundensis TaxID=86185 RepID=UPI0021CCFB78|nr:site-specific integrase [Pseudomonas lundensis]